MSAQGSTVLIADDDQYVRDDLARLLSPEHQLTFSATAAETWRKAAAEKPDLILLDIRFPDCRDLSLLTRLRAELACTEVIVLSSQTSDVSLIVEAIKLGAYDFIAKPFVPEELLNRVRRALQLQRARRAQENLLKALQEKSGIDALVGDSATMQHVRETIRRLTEVEGCVLIRGESGTGKELAARALHYLSKRHGSPFVVVNCCAVPEQLVESLLFGHKRGAFTGAMQEAKGSFEAAEDGTVFLDEVGDMPLSQQGSLLRVLEYRRFTPVGETRERECRARFVLASNRDLRECVRDGTFREDLFYRINVATLQMPPLRSRPEDVPELTDYYVKRLTAEMGRAPVQVSAEVMQLFREYDWPGNVRELKNVLEGALMLGEPDRRELSLQDLPAELLAMRGEGGAGEMTVQERQEKEQLVRALQQCGGNQTKASRLLGCHRNTVRTRLRYYGLASFCGEGESRTSEAG